ncbi:MAG: hypothetical protein H7039_00730 [Bryobacteraceae bacterium]|nr:hypothetical protein [Bryobacteraceae bacterium]
MRKLCIALIAAVAVLPAQGIRNALPQDLTNYLELTETQVREVVQVNLELSRLTATRQSRSFEVQNEINVELQKADPDPMALGLRYRELESIRREINSQRDRTVTAVQSLLSAAQKQKLATLAEAMRIYGTACNALGWNFFTPVSVVTGAILTQPLPVLPNIATFLLGGIGCGGIPTAFRIGDFLPVPLFPN